MTVRFLISHNRPGSVTRIIADTANVFVRRGIETVVHFPAVDWWDHRLFTLRHPALPQKIRQAARLAADLLMGAVARRGWCGLRLHRVDPRVQTARFWATPDARRWSEGDVAVAHPPYLVPHLLNTLPSGKIKLVTILHVNLESALRSPAPETAAWYAHWVALQRLLSIPTVATSSQAQEAAQRLGIRVDRLIPGGVDLELFRPADRPSGNGMPPVITLYCDPNPQKGREVGVEAVLSAKRRFPNIRLRSIGRVTSAQAAGFDENSGYLHGEEYARALRESDIFVYPSRYDGFPAPPLQAMAAGAAVVTTAVEGVTDYAEDGANCLLCSPGDVEGMSLQVGRLIQDGSLRARLRSHGPLTAERFRIEQSAAQLLEFLKQ